MASQWNHFSIAGLTAVGEMSQAAKDAGYIVTMVSVPCPSFQWWIRRVRIVHVRWERTRAVIEMPVRKAPRHERDVSHCVVRLTQAAALLARRHTYTHIRLLVYHNCTPKHARSCSSIPATLPRPHDGHVDQHGAALQVPPESYLDPTTSAFDLSLLHAYPEWHPEFKYHGHNCYAALLAKWGTTKDGHRTFDLVDIQL